MIGFDSISRIQMPESAAISVLTLAELIAGPISVACRASRTHRADRLRRVESSLEAIDFDASCARSYGHIYAAVLAMGRKARGSHAVDLMIAATALAHELPLYTFNSRDLRGLDGLIEIVDLS
ncbi:MAG TPA: PIN domain-containing protein [Solirubrobacterales bacterium]|nr:PIN domain-containing protein [Solirubrobacterales bacterium]